MVRVNAISSFTWIELMNYRGMGTNHPWPFCPLKNKNFAFNGTFWYNWLSILKIL